MSTIFPTNPTLRLTRRDTKPTNSVLSIRSVIVRFPSIAEVPRDSAEGLFGRAAKLAGGEHPHLVAFVAIGVEGETPPRFITEVAQPAEMDRRVAKARKILFAGFRPISRRPVRTGRLWLGVRIDVTELAPKADGELGVAAGEVLLSQRPLRKSPNLTS